MKKKYGGMATINGVMFVCEDDFAIAIRKENGEIETFKEHEKSIIPKSIRTLPFLRGVISVLSIFLDRKTTKAFEMASPIKKEKNHKLKLFGSIILLATGFFLFIEYVLGFLAKAIHSYLLTGVNQDTISTVLFYVFFTIYVYYTFSSPLTKYVRYYHGAEHKVIACYENGEELTIENVKKHSRIHPRCGTSLVGYVIFTKILLFTILTIGHVEDFSAIKFLELPLIFSIGYELFERMSNREIKFLNPIKNLGLWMQSYTTKEPNEDQIEVAIAAFRKLQETNPI